MIRSMVLPQVHVTQTSLRKQSLNDKINGLTSSSCDTNIIEEAVIE